MNVKFIQSAVNPISIPQVLRLLNEQCGEERSVYLSDEWYSAKLVSFCNIFYADYISHTNVSYLSSRYHSVISPGDTVHVIGEFNEEGKCDVNRDNNFLIVHPDILVSGTRVMF